MLRRDIAGSRRSLSLASTSSLSETQSLDLTSVKVPVLKLKKVIVKKTKALKSLVKQDKQPNKR